MKKKQRSPKVFISYAHEDKKKALKLFSDLEKAGVKPWMDKKNLLPGVDWRAEIVKAIRGCDYVIFLLSKTSVNKRGFVQAEMRQALIALDNIPDGQVYLIPARIDNCRPTHEKLGSINWVDLFPRWQDGIKKILLAMKINAIVPRQSMSFPDKESQAQPKHFTRVTMDIRPDAYELLNGLADDLRTSKVETIRRSIGLLAFFTKEKKNGAKIVVERKGGEQVEVIAG